MHLVSTCSPNKNATLPIHLTWESHLDHYDADDMSWTGVLEPVDIKKEREKVTKALRSYKDASWLALANRIQLCEPYEPCRSGACPGCARAFQRAFVERSKSLIEANPEPLVSVSVSMPGSFQYD